MVHIEGTYTTVQAQEYVDFLIGLGVDKERANKLLGTHWTFKIWKDGQVWGGHITCQELPHLNSLQTMVEGVKKSINDPLYGGKATIVFKQTSPTEFLTEVESEQFGSLTIHESYCDVGGKQIIKSATGTSATITWEKKIQFEGAYRFEKGENIEEFNEASGFPEINAHYKNYRLYFIYKKGRVHMAEFFGGLGKAYNSFKPNEETHFRVPGDANDADGSHRILVTKSGHNSHLMTVTGPKGNVQEWNFVFNDCGIVLTGLDKNSGKSCKYYLRRFTEVSGPWKKVSITGFEKFAEAMGVSSDKIKAFADDNDSVLEIHDLGNGVHRHKFGNSAYSLEYSFKMNEEFTYPHPMLKEDVKVVCTQEDNVVHMTMQTSKGIFKSTYTFNHTFLVLGVCQPSTGLGYKVVFIRSPCST